MLHKINHIVEILVITLTIRWQPVFGVLSGLMAFCYYLAMFKINVVDKNHNGSWKQYFKTLIGKK